MEDEKVFDLEDVQPVLREIAAESPGKFTERFALENSPGCRYSHPETGAPSCIIGVLLDRLGFNAGLLAELDQGYSITGVGAESGKFVWCRFTEKALEYMRFVQEFQDGCDNWGTAVARADRSMP